MSRIDDLHTLVRLFKEFELPVSPILEYAINENIKQLSSDDDSRDVMLVNDGLKYEKTDNTTVRTKKETICLTRCT